MTHHNHQSRSSSKQSSSNDQRDGMNKGNTLLTHPSRPKGNDHGEWMVYWKAQKQSWRTEPEISDERQKELARCRSVAVDVEKGIYPFKGQTLDRADVEWLLARHDNGRGPVDWSDENQRKREGLDLRGTNLCGLNLSNLPLARLRAGLSEEEWQKAEKYPLRYEAAAHMEKTVLIGTHLEGSFLNRSFLERAILNDAHLEQADLTSARLQHVRCRNTHMENTDLKWAHLEYAHLRGSNLCGANLTSAYLEGAHLEDVILSDKKQCGIRLADIHWNDTNLAVVQWSQIPILGDEYVARQKEDKGQKKHNNTRHGEYEVAVRANRQLAVALQSQGMNENAACFAYRAQKLQCILLLRQKKLGQYLFSRFLDLLAGYGYRPGRSVVWYLATILVFALAYHFLGGLSLYPPDAFVFSIMSFHGRGFFPALSNETNLHNPLVMLAAVEAIVGLLIEISFIATFTQRFFGR